MTTNEPSQTTAVGIIFGSAVFLLFAFMLFAWCSRKVHRPRLVGGPGESTLSDSEMAGSTGMVEEWGEDEDCDE
jgi:flagellar biosynthesis/type III secretory pathway M-ring protein FliF/YscJ